MPNFPNLENILYKVTDRYYLNGLKNNKVAEETLRANKTLEGELGNVTRENYRILLVCYMLAQGNMSMEDIADTEKDAEKKQQLADLMIQKAMAGDNKDCYKQIILGAHKMSEYLGRSAKESNPGLDITMEEGISTSCMSILSTNFVQNDKYKTVIKPIEDALYRDEILKADTPRYIDVCTKSLDRVEKLWEIIQTQTKIQNGVSIIDADRDIMVNNCVRILYHRNNPDSGAVTRLNIEDKEAIEAVASAEPDFEDGGIDHNAVFHNELRKLENAPFLVEMMPKVLLDNPDVRLEKKYFDEEGNEVDSDADEAQMAYVLTGADDFADLVKKEYDKQCANTDPTKYLKQWQEKKNTGYATRMGRMVPGERNNWEKLPENCVRNNTFLSSLDILESTYNSLHLNSTKKFDDLVNALREYKSILEENAGKNCDLEKLYDIRGKLLKVEQKADDYFIYKVESKPKASEKTAFARLNCMPRLMKDLNQELFSLDSAIYCMEKERFAEKEGDRTVSLAETVQIMGDKIYSKEEGSSGRYFADTYTALYNTTEKHGFSNHFRKLMEKLADMESIRKRAINTPNAAYLPKQYRLALREVKLAAQEYIDYKEPSKPSGVGLERLNQVRHMMQVIGKDIDDLNRADMGMIEQKNKDTVFLCERVKEASRELKAELAAKKEPVGYSEAARMVMFSMVEKKVNLGIKGLEMEKILAPYKLCGECRKIMMDTSFQNAMKEYQDSGLAFDPDSFFKSYVTKKSEEAVREQKAAAPKEAEASKVQKAPEIPEQNLGL